jgi:hypothetical protein
MYNFTLVARHNMYIWESAEVFSFSIYTTIKVWELKVLSFSIELRYVM